MKLQRTSVALILAVSFWAISCKQETVAPPEDTGPFSLAITVVDTNGARVGGLVVSAWNHISGLQSPKIAGAGSMVSKVASSTSIGFQIPVTCHAVLEAYDLDGRLVTTIADLPGALAGLHRATFSISDTVGTRVFICRFIAYDASTGGVLYRDSIYAVLWQNDASLSVLGQTTIWGRYVTADSLLFPNVLNLPAISLTGTTDPTPIGVLHISDSVTVVLADTVAKKSQSIVLTIKRGTNDIRLVWNPKAAVPKMVERPIPRGVTSTGYSIAADSRGGTWKLEQNYPNPFN